MAENLLKMSKNRGKLAYIVGSKWKIERNCRKLVGSVKIQSEVSGKLR